MELLQLPITWYLIHFKDTLSLPWSHLPFSYWWKNSQIVTLRMLFSILSHEIHSMDIRTQGQKVTSPCITKPYLYMPGIISRNMVHFCTYVHMSMEANSLLYWLWCQVPFTVCISTNPSIRAEFWYVMTRPFRHSEFQYQCHADYINFLNANQNLIQVQSNILF